MSARSNLAIAISSKGWDKFSRYVGNVLTPDKHDTIIECFMDALKHQEHPSGAHLVFFESINMKTGIQELIKTIKTLNEEDYYIVELVIGSSIPEMRLGSFYNNPFGIAVVHSIFMNENSCDEIFPEHLSF
jgi:hypothetical protein